MNNISIVIPALNEPYLNTLKEKIKKELKTYDLIEIIIDDSKGCGQAIINGIKKTSGDIIIIMDADGSHNPKYLPYMIDSLIKNELDVVYGVKKVNEDSLYRKLITNMFGLLSRILIRDYPDLMSGFFAFKKELKNSLPEKINHPKVLMKLIQLNPDIEIYYIPIVFEKRKKGKSKLGKPIIAYRILKDMIKR